MAAKILVPIDLQHKSTWIHAVPSGARQAEVNDGEVWLMTVVPQAVGGLDWRYAVRGEELGSTELDVKDLVKQAESRLDEIANEFIPAERFGGKIAAHGVVHERIVEAADAIGAEMIVMAAHRPSLAGYLLSPNTDRVARHAKCSVQIVRG